MGGTKRQPKSGNKASVAVGGNSKPANERERGSAPKLKPVTGVVVASKKNGGVAALFEEQETPGDNGVPKFIAVDSGKDHNNVIDDGEVNELGGDRLESEKSDEEDAKKDNHDNLEGGAELGINKKAGNIWMPDGHKEMVAASDEQRKTMIKSFVKTKLFKTTKFLVHEKQMEWDSEIFAVPILDELGVEDEERRKQMWERYKVDAKKALHKRRATVNGSIKNAVIGEY
jgi:hypothetical protein